MSKPITPERRREIARAAGIHEQYLYQCLTGRREMSPAEARRIETQTAGELTRQMLCQRTWRDIWPELGETTAPGTVPQIERQAVAAGGG